MMAWLGVEQEAAPKLSLDAEMQNSITAIFQMLRGGGLTLSKLREALASTGIDAEDLKSAFQEFDQDGNGALDANELASMMASSRV
jgi:Ca2+-binding EF-hand superfamily protein